MEGTVQVNVKVTIDVGNKWSDGCTIGQLKKQAREEAVALATRALKNDPSVKAIHAGDVVFSAVL